ncbi:MAG: hypothetical protein ACRDI1_09510 [Actinomycetota bacterium]
MEVPGKDEYLEKEGPPDLHDRTVEEEMVVPGDSPRAVTDRGTTAGEQREGDSLDERMEREVPEEEEREEADQPKGRLVEPKSEDQVDETAEMVARKRAETLRL